MAFLRRVFGDRPTSPRRRQPYPTRVTVGTTALGEPLQRWEWGTRSALAELGIGYDEATTILAAVRRRCSDNGQTPWDAFGSPGDCAAMMARGVPAR
jgi:hypothetical protein